MYGCSCGLGDDVLQVRMMLIEMNWWWAVGLRVFHVGASGWGVLGDIRCCWAVPVDVFFCM